MCLGLTIINGYFFAFLNYKFFHFNSSGNNIDMLPRSEQFFLSVIIAPILETFIAQFILFKILRLKITHQPLLIVLGSLFFASMHYYNWLYMVVTFFIGLIINYYYLEIQKISKYSFLLTVLLHSLYNLYGYLFIS